MLLLGFQTASTAQEGSGLVVQPPAEVLAGEYHPAPPIPFPPMPHPAPPDPAGPGSGFQGNLDRPEMRTSVVSPEEIRVQPPLSVSAPDRLTTEALAPLATTIAPPIDAEPKEFTSRNPFLPPGPDQRSAARDRFEGEERSSRAQGARRSSPISRERPGLLAGVFDRLIGRSSPAPPSLPEPVAPPLNLDPSDPTAPEILKQQLERMILQREADRLSSIELLIVGPRVHIRAEAARPWQRLALRRGLERLPMPTGFHSTVEVH